MSSCVSLYCITNHSRLSSLRKHLLLMSPWVRNLSRAQRRRFISVNLRMLKTQVNDVGWTSLGGWWIQDGLIHMPGLRPGCQLNTWFLLHMVTPSMCPLQQDSLCSKRTKAGAARLLQAESGADCFPMLSVPKARRMGAGAVPQAALPQRYFFPHLCWCLQAFMCPFQVPWRCKVLRRARHRFQGHRLCSFWLCTLGAYSPSRDMAKPLSQVEK